MNLTQMNSLLSLSKSFSDIQTYQSANVRQEGAKGVLEMEIAQDKSRGVDTSSKEKQLEKINERQDLLKDAMFNTMDSVNEEIKNSAAAAEEEETEEVTSEKTLSEKLADIRKENDETYSVTLHTDGKTDVKVAETEVKTDKAKSETAHSDAGAKPVKVSTGKVDLKV